jgi:lysozyme
MMKYYNDGGKNRGNCTWGIGIKAHNGPCTPEELARTVTDADIEREFAKRLRVAERGVNRNLKVDVTQAQFDALVSLAYNRGVDGTGIVFDVVNKPDFGGAATLIASLTSVPQMRNGKRVDVFMRGLVPRRAEEAAPFRNAPNPPQRSAAK